MSNLWTRSAIPAVTLSSLDYISAPDAGSLIRARQDILSNVSIAQKSIIDVIYKESQSTSQMKTSTSIETFDFSTRTSHRIQNQSTHSFSLLPGAIAIETLYEHAMVCTFCSSFHETSFFPLPFPVFLKVRLNWLIGESEINHLSSSHPVMFDWSTDC